MENILQKVNSRFVSIPEEEIRENNAILKSVFDVIIQNMKSVDKLFEALYRRPFYGGSYYDRLHVKTYGQRYDYDLDLLLSIPEKARPTLLRSDIPGHIQLQVRNVSWFETSSVYAKFKKTFLDGDNYLITDKALRWMESVVQKSFNHLLPLPFGTSYLSVGANEFPISFSKSGPALTLHIEVDNDRTLDVDLVISFVFTKDEWPDCSPNPYLKYLSCGGSSCFNEFFIVAKKPKNVPNYLRPERSWRLSFQEQERQLIANKERLKPKLKKRQQHDKIASYYIKTVLLFMVEERSDAFWQQSLSYVFLEVLQTYTNFIRNKQIPYYWNEEYNLIGHIDHRTLTNFADRLEYIIKDIKRKPDEPGTVVEYLLNFWELGLFFLEKAKDDDVDEESSCTLL